LNEKGPRKKLAVLRVVERRALDVEEPQTRDETGERGPRSIHSRKHSRTLVTYRLARQNGRAKLPVKRRGCARVRTAKVDLNVAV